jgi:transposase
MGYVSGTDRGQASLLPDRIEDYVAADAAVRVIDAFVDRLDVAGLGFRRAAAALMGRPCYDPRDLLKLYIYGYFNEVRSSRRLERECRRNIEAMWLLGRLAPDFKTIADFRRDNGPAIIGACRAFVLICRDAGLFTARLVALDGSKFRAAASARKIMGRSEIEAERCRLDRKIADYLSGLDTHDRNEPDDAADAVASAIASLESRRAELDRMAKRLDDEGRNTLVDGEADARPMGIGKGPKPPAYNVQTAVDAECGLIVHHEVTDAAGDNRMLHPMAKATKAALDLDSLTVVADAGYSNGAQASACEDDAITACAPANRTVNNSGDGTLFDRTAFAYDITADRFVCPAGKHLDHKQVMNRDRLVLYAAKAQDCSACLLKSQCTAAARRFVTRHFDEDALNRMNERATPEMMRTRRCTAEHPFGTIKRMMAGGRFLTRNFTGTRTEMALSVLAYNIMRSINMKTMPA